MKIPGIDILYRDQRIIVLDKPTGLLSVPGIGPNKADCLATRVQAVFPEARIVHRLDRDTSGVIMMALDAEAHREISRQFHDRETQKKYIALVAGRVTEDEGEIDLPMRKDMDNPPKQLIDHQQGRSALTRWRVLERTKHQSGSDITRIELRPVTGRSHQLRVHMAELGHPILGDDLYASGDVLVLSDRLCLHAQWLWITHPGNAAPIEFESLCPF